MTKRLEVYRAILALAINGICEATQAQIAARAGVRRQNLPSILRYLEKSRMIAIVNFTKRHYGARCRYIPLIESAKPDSKNEIESAKPDSKNEIESAKPDSIPLTNHVHACMNDELIIKNNKRKSKQEKTQILALLDMLDPGERLKRSCQRHVTVAYAQQWRNWYDSGEFGEIVNPAGYINWAIKNKLDPPNANGQIALPGGAIDLSSFVSRGMTREEIESALSPGDGATYGDDGIWR